MYNVLKHASTCKYLHVCFIEQEDKFLTKDKMASLNTVEPLFPDTIGATQSVLIKEVSSFQKYCKLKRNAVVGTLESVLFIEESLFQSVMIREVPLYVYLLLTCSTL